MWVILQVSELSHKLGTAEGNCKSMEEELTRLQNQNIQLSKSRSERDVEANELQAKLRAADEKVHHWGHSAPLERSPTMLWCSACLEDDMKKPTISVQCTGQVV